jgi:sugar/nucleoside kinase (ribokinase family)
MAILVVGSVAFDSIETPHGKRAKILGGAATHFALAASYFTDVRVIAVVGEDFLPEHEAVFTKRGIDTQGIERAPGLSFHWTGAYAGNLSEAQTLGTDLNVFERFEPKIPEAYTDSEYLFLANIDPVLQARVRSHMPKVRMVCGDTMNYWIKDHAANLLKVLRELDVLLINDGEARMLSGESNSVRAAEKVLAMGPKALVMKHGVGGGGGPDRCGRFVCGRVLWLPRIAAGTDAGGLSQGDVLWRRDGVVRVRTLWHRAPAGGDARGDRRAV